MSPEAIKIAQQITNTEDSGENGAFQGNGITIEYRHQYDDWVTWDDRYVHQLEGTLRGNNDDFVKWGENFLVKRMLHT